MIAIRFDGPPSHESGRFIEVERDGASISFGKWKQDGEYWLLELPEVDRLEARIKKLRDGINSATHILDGGQGEYGVVVKYANKAQAILYDTITQDG